MAITLADVLSKADPNLIADALRKVNIGVMLAPQSETLTGVGLTVVLSKAAFGAGSVAVNVTAGAAAGIYVVGSQLAGPALVDAVAGTSPGICSLGADGKTITFKSAPATAVVSYMAASESDLTAAFSDFV